MAGYAYPPKYKGPKEITAQIKLIGNAFALDTKYALLYAKKLPLLPGGAEGWFAIPKLSALTKKHFPEISDPARQYCEAVIMALRKIESSRSFYNYRRGDIVTAKLRQHKRTVRMLEILEQKQPGDILIIPAQLGMRYRGMSVYDARKSFSSNEFGLGTLAVCSIALTHPERLAITDELDLDCPGDEFAPELDGAFSKSPYFFFYIDQVRFNALHLSDASWYCGSVSGFIHQ